MVCTLLALCAHDRAVSDEIVRWDIVPLLLARLRAAMVSSGHAAIASADDARFASLLQPQPPTPLSGAADTTALAMTPTVVTAAPLSDAEKPQVPLEEADVRREEIVAILALLACIGVYFEALPAVLAVGGPRFFFPLFSPRVCQWDPIAGLCALRATSSLLAHRRVRRLSRGRRADRLALAASRRGDCNARSAQFAFVFIACGGLEMLHAVPLREVPSIAEGVIVCYCSIGGHSGVMEKVLS